jgi:hypothetical protein
MQSIDERFGRLMNAYLGEAINLDEYRLQKNQLMLEKRSIEDQIVALEKNRTS